MMTNLSMGCNVSSTRHWTRHWMRHWTILCTTGGFTWRMRSKVFTKEFAKEFANIFVNIANIRGAMMWRTNLSILQQVCTHMYFMYICSSCQRRPIGNKRLFHSLFHMILA